MASSNDFDEGNVENLTTIFKEGLDLYNNVCTSEEPINNLNIQLNIKSSMRKFEEATRLVSFTAIFSRNEGIEEISTNDLQYFLLPALLGSLSLKLTTGERKDIIDVAEIYFKDFLTRCNDYNLSNYQFKDKKEDKSVTNDFEQIAVSINTRSNKIQRYREQKELKTKLSDLKKVIDNEHADEEIKRDYFLTMIKLFIYEAIDELNSIDMEKPILEHMSTVQKDSKPMPKRPPAPPLRPIIITKDDLQKAVYGAGYPSLPTMTVQEFYDKRVSDGIFPDPTKKPTGPLSMQQAALAGVELNNEDAEDQAKENAVEDDDPDNLQRMRNMDEFKDTHRRGWGNRMNRS